MRREVEDYIRVWQSRCYDDLPVEAPKRLENLGKVPSYRVLCMAILKNDTKSIGGEVKRSRYYDILKRKELKERGVITQMEIFDA